MILFLGIEGDSFYFYGTWSDVSTKPILFFIYYSYLVVRYLT